MARRQELGVTDTFSTPQPCEAGSCKQQTQEALWDGGRYRYLCEQHREPLAEKLREKGQGMSSTDLV
jgi:hypothetical protein